MTKFICGCVIEGGGWSDGDPKRPIPFSAPNLCPTHSGEIVSLLVGTRRMVDITYRPKFVQEARALVEDALTRCECGAKSSWRTGGGAAAENLLCDDCKREAEAMPENAHVEFVRVGNGE